MRLLLPRRISIISLLTVFITSSSLGSYAIAQKKNHLDKYENKIIAHGIIKTEKDMEILPFSTISIRTLGTKNEKTYSQVCDEKANFTISLINAPQYEITVKFAGMKTKNFIVKDKSKLSQMTILMQEDETNLKEVVVSKTKNLIKVNIDRLAYDLASDPDTPLQTVFEMLRKVPLVTITGQDEIQVKGNSNFSIFINGKPSKIFGEKPQDVLKTMPASSIKRIEVITDPGVKYSAEGSSTILNLVMNDNVNSIGYNGQIFSRYRMTLGNEQYSIINGASLGLAKENWGINLNYSNDLDLSKKTRGFFNKSKVVKNYETLLQDGPSEGNGNRLSVSSYYNISNKDLLSANIFTKVDDDSNLFREIQYKNETYIYKNSEKEKSVSANLSIDYQHTFSDNEKNFTLSYQFNNRNKNSAYNRWNGVDTLISVQDPSKSKYRENTIQADFDLPISENNKIEVGAKYINRYNYSYSDYKLDNHIRKFEYIYNIGALYLKYSTKINNIAFSIGARGEISKINFTNEDIKTSLSTRFDWIPNISLAYNISNNTMLKLNYHFFIKRPSLWQLNPNKTDNSGTYYAIGNENLKSERRNTLSLDLNSFTNDWSTQLSFQYNFTNNRIGSVINRDPQNPDITVLTYKNLDKFQGYSSNLYIGYNGINWLRPWLNGTVSMELFNTSPKRAISYNLFTGAQVFLPYNFSVNFNAGIFKFNQDNRIKAKGIGVINTSIGISKSFFERKLNIGLNTNYFNNFSSEVIYSDNTTATFYQYTYPRISLSISYNFGKMKTNMKSIKGKIQNDDQSDSSSTVF